jgi:hypothetical protein
MAPRRWPATGAAWDSVNGRWSESHLRALSAEPSSTPLTPHSEALPKSEPAWLATTVRIRGCGRRWLVSVDQEQLIGMLTRLKLTALRDQLDSLLDEAARREINLREALAFLCEAEVARKGKPRIQMAMSIAHFPFVRTLEGFDFEAQPSARPRAAPGACHRPLDSQWRCDSPARSTGGRKNAFSGGPGP